MGILETRNLDFRNVVLLSMNDDNFPAASWRGTSFIPYNLRAAFDLPTPAHHEGVYAYYFYRLVQRAENVSTCSIALMPMTRPPANRAITSTSSISKPVSGSCVEVGVDVNLTENPPIEVAKEGDAGRSWPRFVDPESPAALPTAFFRYVACPLRFYFYSVAPGWSQTTI